MINPAVSLEEAARNFATDALNSGQLLRLGKIDLHSRALKPRQAVYRASTTKVSQKRHLLSTAKILGGARANRTAQTAAMQIHIPSTKNPGQLDWTSAIGLVREEAEL